MKPIINKEDDLVKRFLQIRQELLDYAANDDKLKNILDYIIEEEKLTSVLIQYDKNITLNKLPKNARSLLDGYDLFILADSILSDNIKIAYID